MLMIAMKTRNPFQVLVSTLNLHSKWIKSTIHVFLIEPEPTDWCLVEAFKQELYVVHVFISLWTSRFEPSVVTDQARALVFCLHLLLKRQVPLKWLAFLSNLELTSMQEDWVGRITGETLCQAIRPVCCTQSWSLIGINISGHPKIKHGSLEWYWILAEQTSRQ